MDKLNVLDDIDNDLSADWSEIAKEIEDKERAKFRELDKVRMMNNKKRIDFPSYDEFYSLLIEILQSYDFDEAKEHHISYRIKELVARIFRYRYSSEVDLPESFKKVWEIYCDPRRYRCNRNVKCRYCGIEYDIFYEDEMITTTSLRMDDYMNASESEFIVNENRINCPNCTSTLVVFRNRRLFGMFLSKDD